MNDDPPTSEKLERIESALEDAGFTVLRVSDVDHERGFREFDVDLTLLDRGVSNE